VCERETEGVCVYVRMYVCVCVPRKVAKWYCVLLPREVGLREVGFRSGIACTSHDYQPHACMQYMKMYEIIFRKSDLF